MAAVRRPTVPAPIMRAVEPGNGLARLTAWMATERGSRRAAALKEILSGILSKKKKSALPIPINPSLEMKRVPMTPFRGVIYPLL